MNLKTSNIILLSEIIHKKKVIKLFVNRVDVFLFLLVLFFVQSCTHVYKPPHLETINHPVQEKMNLNIELNIDDEFRNYQWERHSMGDTFILPLGESFTKQTIALSKQIFSDVKVTESNQPTFEDVDAVLKPSVVMASKTTGATAFGESILTAVIEWSFMDRQGNEIWVETVKGTGVEKSGNVFTHKNNTTIQTGYLLEDLFQKSFQEIYNSIEIREYSKNLNTTNQS